MDTKWLYNRSYPISMWNCYEATLSNDPRTNNQAEGNNNNALNTAAGCSSPTIYRLMDNGHPQRIQRGVRVEDPPDDYRASSNKEAPQQHHQDEGAS